MAPSDYVAARKEASSHDNTTNGKISTKFCTTVDGRPYLPLEKIDPSDEASVCRGALAVVATAASATGVPGVTDADIVEEYSTSALTCVRVTGGITNALFRVSGFHRLPPVAMSDDAPSSSPSPESNSVLVRIFGAEGMIDRDVENSTYAALCDASIGPPYVGRFANGRVEGWLDGYKALTTADLSSGGVSSSENGNGSDDGAFLGVARETARLHTSFHLPPGELSDCHAKVGLWDQLTSWMRQARGYEDEHTFKTEHDAERATKLDLRNIETEVDAIVASFQNSGATDSCCTRGGKITFCHNDLLAGNVMRHAQTGRVRLIDFEYGGTNYAAFDVANHFNEHAGGTTVEENGQTRYENFPSEVRQVRFVEEYVRSAREFGESNDNGCGGENGDDSKKGRGVGVEEEANDLLSKVRQFVLVNHLYWGLWAVNQAAEEGCDEFDYLVYASNRFGEYRSRTAKKEEEKSA